MLHNKDRCYTNLKIYMMLLVMYELGEDMAGTIQSHLPRDSFLFILQKHFLLILSITIKAFADLLDYKARRGLLAS